MKTNTRLGINSSFLNPFNLGGPAREEGFYNRKEILESIRTFIFSSPGETHLLITGQRRIGKTSLLRRIQDTAGNGIHAIYYDMQDKTQLTLKDLLYDLGKKNILDLEHSFSFNKDKIGEPEFFKTSFCDKITNKFKNDEILLLLFDEFDVLGNLPETNNDPLVDELAYNSFVPFVIKWIEAIRDYKFPIKLIFAAGRNYKDLNQERYGSLTKFGKQIELSLFTKPVVENLIKGLADEFLPFSKEAIETLFTITAGHPYFTQALASEAFNLAVKNQEKEVTEKNIISQYSTAIKSVAGGILWLWDGFSPQQKILLYILSIMEEEKISFSRILVEKQAKQLLLFPVIENLNKIINELIRMKIIKPSVGQNEILCSGFVVPFFRKWILQENTHKEMGILLDEFDEEMELNLRNGRFYFKKRNFDKALFFYEAVLTKSPYHTESLYCVYEIIKKQSRKDKSLLLKAFSYIEKAYDQIPDRYQTALEEVLLEITINSEKLDIDKENIGKKAGIILNPSKEFRVNFFKVAKQKGIPRESFLLNLDEKEILALIEEEKSTLSIEQLKNQFTNSMNNSQGESLVFVSYAREDNQSQGRTKGWLDLLLVHLKRPLEQAGIELFIDNTIITGEYLPAIKYALEKASVAVLLLSPGFMNSVYIIEKELPIIISRYKAHNLEIFPILISPCTWDLLRIEYPDPANNNKKSHFLLSQLLLPGHSPDEPLDTLSDSKVNEVFKEVTKRILAYHARHKMLMSKK